MIFFCYFFSLLLFFFGLAIVTYVERKYLSLRAFRFGINFLFVYGVFQPIRDFLKLIIRKIIFLDYVEGIFWVLTPFWGLIIFVILFFFFSFLNWRFFFFFGVLLFLSFYSIIIFKFLYSRWLSRRVYRIISSFRVIIHCIRYEVGFIFIFIIFLFFFGFLDFFVFFSMDFFFFLYF